MSKYSGFSNEQIADVNIKAVADGADSFIGGGAVGLILLKIPTSM